MSIVDGPINASDDSSPLSSSSSYGWQIANKGDTMRICTERNITSPTATGKKGEFCWGSQTVLGITTFYWYLCIADNQWVRFTGIAIP